MKISVPVFLLVTVLFFFSHSLQIPVPVIALTGAALVLLLGRIKPSRIIKNVDWVLLLFFASLFIVVEGAVKTGLLDSLVKGAVLENDWKGIGILHGLSLLVSQIVSNVPYTVMMLPAMHKMNSEILWLSLASASTLAGNATVIGAVANLIVIESAGAAKVRIGFLEFLKTGLLVTLVTLLVSWFMLWIWTI